MTSAKSLFDYIVRNVTAYSHKEARAIAFMLLEHYLRLRNVDVLVDKPIPVNDSQPDWDKIIERLNQSEPVQHIIGSTYFCNLEFKVSPSVLIPRPETEELVRLVVKDCYWDEDPVKIVDIGTGSGCIAIALDRFMSFAKVWGWDVSDDALGIAQENAQRLLSEVTFEKYDILKEDTFEGQFDCVVSNPPYVTHAEQNEMELNVLRFEPHLALFVEDNDPLLFYRAIADFCLKHLKKTGACYVEINEHFGAATKQLFIEKGFKKVDVIQDMYGKDRIVKAKLSTEGL
ncbi:MAG: peptide chain release factor N(5)-glutamine methyltransferase [Spirosomataceae bacterium]